MKISKMSGREEEGLLSVGGEEEEQYFPSLPPLPNWITAGGNFFFPGGRRERERGKKMFGLRPSLQFFLPVQEAPSESSRSGRKEGRGRERALSGWPNLIKKAWALMGKVLSCSA